MTTGLDICVVINQLLGAVPREQTVLLDALTNYRDSLWNQAPEARRTAELWRPFMALLNHHIPHIDTDWKQNMVNIVNNT